MVGSRNIYSLRLTGPGQIHVHASWTGTQSNLSLIINGPGQAGYYARVDGASPLDVSYNVTSADFASGDSWELTIASFGSGNANGNVDFTYPSGSPTNPFSTQFTVANNSVSSISLVVLTFTGTIKGQATWTGSPANLAFIINGPGQVGYFARNDGPSPLSVSYAVTQANYSQGRTWMVSLVSFNTTNLSAQINISYP